jgi:hypothetical protein
MHTLHSPRNCTRIAFRACLLPWLPSWGFVIGERFTQPAIAEIVVTSDGLVLARTDGEASETHFIGSYADLLRNWLALIAIAGLTTRELIEAQTLFAAKIGFFGTETA